MAHLSEVDIVIIPCIFKEKPLDNIGREEEYWNCKKILVNENGEDYYVIRRRENVGLFSFYITTLAQIRIAIEKGLIPIVDLMNYSNTYMGLDSIGEYNPWEKMFVQPNGKSLIEVQKNARELIYCTEDVPSERPCDELSFLTSLNDSNNAWRILARDYLKINSRIIKEARDLFDEISEHGNYKMLGVLCRGTDYIKLRPKEHPIQPSVEELFDRVDCVIKDRGCQRLFLATEDQGIEDSFIDKFGNIVCLIDEKKVKYSGSGYLGDSIRLLKQQDRMQLGITYLKKILILSMCNCFVAGRTSGTIGVMLQDHSFEYTYFFDKGRYE